MVKEGYYFGLPLLVLGGAAYLTQWTVAAVVCVCLALFVFSFFRDPERVIPSRTGAIVSPARRPGCGRDGRGKRGPAREAHQHFSGSLERAREPRARGRSYHEDGIPAGEISRGNARTGFDGKRAEHFHTLDGCRRNGLQADCRLIARRVVSWKKSGERVARGERIGLVRFGSRADVWVPQDAQILVKLGDNVKGGATVLARWAPQSAGLEASEKQHSEPETGMTAVEKSLRLWVKSNSTKFRLTADACGIVMRRGIFLLPAMMTSANLLCGYYAVVAVAGGWLGRL